MAAALPSRVQTAPRGDGWAAPRMRGAGARRRRRARGAGLKGGGGGVPRWGSRRLSLAPRPLRAVFCLAPLSASRPLPSGKALAAITVAPPSPRRPRPQGKAERSSFLLSLLPAASRCLTLWFGHSTPQDQGVCGRLCGRVGVRAVRVPVLPLVCEVLKLPPNAAR